MALPSYTLSTSVLNVDCTSAYKIIFLPPASTIQGVPLLIRDNTGLCSQESSIFVSTQGLDLLDRYESTIRLSTGYQSVRFVAWQETQYAILQNYMLGLTPFITQFPEGYAWIARESVRLWRCVASSSSGATLVAGVGGGRLYVSINAGGIWTAYGPTLVWRGVAVSSTGTKMVAVANGDRIYTSTNTGVSWTPRASSKSWTCVCSSSDGSILLAGATSDFLYISTNSGVSWTFTNINADYTAVACSSDGSVMFAATNGGTLYVSTNSGSTWTSRDSARNWTGLACSSDGVTAYATEGTYIYKSTDTGTTWTANTSYSAAWRSISCDSPGTTVVAINGTSGSIQLSVDSGVTFVQTGDSDTYGPVAIDGNANQILTAGTPGTLYVGLLQLL